MCPSWWDLVDTNQAARRFLGGIPGPEAGASLTLIDALMGPGRDRFVEVPQTVYTSAWTIFVR